jgi:hypothetical protein
MTPLTDLLSSYPILLTLSSFISTLDLYHLALTSKAHHNLILESPQRFQKLRRRCLCTGHGLADRQNFRGHYALDGHGGWRYQGYKNRQINRDEPIEIQLFNLKCDEAGALPCVRCGINVCEQCRCYDREELLNLGMYRGDSGARPVGERRPHLTASATLRNVMCLCVECDAGVESEVKGKFLNELCDCDMYNRWICSKCDMAERKFTREYFKEHTVLDFEAEHEGKTKSVIDHIEFMAVSFIP